MGLKFGFSKFLVVLTLFVSVVSVNARAEGGVVIGHNSALAPTDAIETQLKMVVEYQYSINYFTKIDEELLPMTDGGEATTIRYRFYDGAYIVQFVVFSKFVNGAWQFTVVRSDETNHGISTMKPVDFTLMNGQSTRILFKKWVDHMGQNFRIKFSI